MDGLESVFLFLDYLTDTKRKRHLVGGGPHECFALLWRTGIHHDDD